MNEIQTFRCQTCKILFDYIPPEGEPTCCPKCGQVNEYDFTQESNILDWEYGQEGRCGGCSRIRGIEHSESCDMHICRQCGGRRIKCGCGSINEPKSDDGIDGRTKVEPDDVLHKLTREIIQKRHEILEAFSKAYLAENLKDVPIRDLILIEKQMPPTHPMELQGYSYWFERKETTKPPAAESNQVNSPKHYQGKGMEAIDVIEAFDLGFNIGNVIKYLLRAGKKKFLKEDLQKAKWYLEREISKNDLA